MIDCAVILAAGANRRMGSGVASKALLPLGGETILSRHVDALRRHGVENVFVVVSHRSVEQFAELRNLVDLVESPVMDLRAGSSLSLLFGLDAVQHRYPLASALVMDADTVYEHALMERVVRSARDDSLLFTIDRARGDGEEVLVYCHETGQPALIGKSIPETVYEGLHLAGESMGMIFLTSRDVQYCRHLIRWIAGQPPDRRGFGFCASASEHEELWQYFFGLGRLSVQKLPADFLFAECDTQEDYSYIRNDLLPAIRQRSSVLSGPR